MARTTPYADWFAALAPDDRVPGAGRQGDAIDVVGLLDEGEWCAETSGHDARRAGPVADRYRAGCSARPVPAVPPV